MAMQPKKKKAAPPPPKKNVNRKSGRRRPSQLTATEIKAMKEAFALFDKNNDGEIDHNEIADVFVAMGLDIEKAEVHDILDDLDENGDGHIDFAEFITFIDRRMSINSQRLELQEAFANFDKDGDGFITFQDLKIFF
jgi:calmodulin